MPGLEVVRADRGGRWVLRLIGGFSKPALEVLARVAPNVDDVGDDVSLLPGMDLF